MVVKTEKSQWRQKWLGNCLLHVNIIPALSLDLYSKSTLPRTPSQSIASSSPFSCFSSHTHRRQHSLVQALYCSTSWLSLGIWTSWIASRNTRTNAAAVPWKLFGKQHVLKRRFWFYIGRVVSCQTYAKQICCGQRIQYESQRRGHELVLTMKLSKQCSTTIPRTACGLHACTTWSQWETAKRSKYHVNC